MSAIQTGIELNDQFTGVLYGIINSVNLAVYSMQEMQSTMNTSVDSDMLDGAIEQINQATMLANEYQDTLDRLRENAEKGISTPMTAPTSEAPEPEIVPVQWESSGVDVFTTSGYERFQQEVQSTNDMLNTLNQTQAQIEQTASGIDILPDAAIQDINGMGQRLQAIQQRIQQIENNPVNLGTDTANAELEQLRSQLNTAIQEQNELNQAMQNMDVSAANDAYLRLSQTVSGTERYIRDNVDEQGRFNQEIRAGTIEADNLMDTIKGVVAAYVSIQSVGSVLNISDELASTTARLNLMNDNLQTTQELENMIYVAAQNARGSFGDMAASVAKLGNLAGDAFDSSAEIVAFAEQLNKQMKLSGASTQEASSAMLQLTQSLAKGTLNGDELTSVMENGSMVVQTIADYMGVAQGEIKDLAAEGQITSDIIVAAMLGATDETNAAFESLPMTWADVWQNMKNGALVAFRPVLQRINDFANSTAVQDFVNGAVQALAILAAIALDVIDFMESGAAFISENWSIIAPIVYGIVGALAVYAAYLGIVKGIELASAAAKGVLAVAEFIHVAALAAQTGATISATAAQLGLNGAMYACPIVWIIMLIIALIAIIFAVCSAIAKLTGVANSGFGVITGGINVVIQFFKNLGLTVANIALGIGNAIAALGSNIMTAFHNAICSVQAWWYDLLSTCLSVIESICAALNKLPFVEFDYSGISNAADDYAAKAAEAAGNKEDYTSISDAFNDGFSTFDTFQDGWAADAFDAGASWGDGVADAVSNFSLSDVFGSTDIPNVDDYTSGFNDAIANSGVGDNLGSIADDTGAIKDNMDITQEDLKYMRDIAERDIIDKYTLAEVHIEQNNTNTINSGDDIDGFMTKLTDSVNEAVDNMTEGVHD